MKRRLGLASTAMLVVVAASGSAGWYTFAGIVEDNVDVWIAQQRSHGVDMDYAGVAVSGYPTVWNVEVAQPTAAARTQSVPWIWHGPDMVVGFAAWAPRDISIDAAGDHAVELALPRGAASVAASAATASANLRIGEDGALDSVDIALADLAVDSPDLPLGFAAGSASLTARRHAVVDGATDQPSLTLVFDGRAITLPALLDGPLGRDVTRAAVEARVLGAIPNGPADLALAYWRDAGGTLEVTKLSLRWGTIEMSARGTLALDDELQPRGALTAQVAGLIDAVGAFERAGVMRPNEAAAARVLFTALSRPDEAGGTVIVLPAVIEDQTLLLGPLPVMTIPRIRWARSP